MYGFTTVYEYSRDPFGKPPRPAQIYISPTRSDGAAVDFNVRTLPDIRRRHLRGGLVALVPPGADSMKGISIGPPPYAWQIAVREHLAGRPKWEGIMFITFKGLGVDESGRGGNIFCEAPGRC
jgi:hypothetical protein